MQDLSKHYITGDRILPGDIIFFVIGNDQIETEIEFVVGMNTTQMTIVTSKNLKKVS